MKRFFALLMSSLLVISLAACTGGTESNPAGSSASDPTASGTVKTEPTEDTNPTGDTEPTKNTEPVTVKMGVPTAPPALPILHMMEENLLGDNVTIELDVWNAPEQLIAMVQDSEHDIFAFPLTVIAKLYNNGLPLRLMNVNTWGVTYFLTTDPDFQSWSDLAGKTVYIPLQSSPPDALTQYFLDEAGLTVDKDVKVIYASTSEVAALLASGEAEYATLIEPQVTSAMTKNSNVRRALSFETEWQRVTGTDTMIPNAGLGTTQAFIDEYPELAEQFQTAYGESVQWVLDNPAETAALAEKYLEMDAAVVEKAIPNMGLYFKSAEDAKPELNAFYELLNNFDSTMIGGKLPDDAMYYHAG